MDKKSTNLIARSISDEVQHWQIYVLNTARNTLKFTKYKTDFKIVKVDYKKMLEEMDEILIKQELEMYFLDVLGSGSVFNYKLEMSKACLAEAHEYIRVKYNFELSKIIQEFIIEMVKFQDKFGNIGKEGFVLFETFGILSEQLQAAHPESKVVIVNITEEEIKKFEKTNGHKMSKKDKKEMLALKRYKHFKPVDMYTIPITYQVCLYTCLSKCKIWPRMMTSVPANKPHALGFLATWFQGFKRKHKRFVKSTTDLWIMNSREVRTLRKNIWCRIA